MLLVGAGFLIAFAAMLIYTALQPPPQRLTQRDINAAVARAMASATPPPSVASQVYAAVFPSVVRIDATDKTDATKHFFGTGVILDDRGNIISSLHIVSQAGSIHIIFADGTEANGDIITQQPENDIVIIQADTLPDDIVPATLGNPNSLHVGDEAIALGNPFGIPYTLTDGVISGLNRSFKSSKTGTTLNNLIQFDAAVNPGNSGGPLLNRDGEVIGIVTALYNPTDQDVFVGIGFAVPIDTAANAAGSPPY